MGYANDTRARLAREDYVDWLTTFRPIENQLLNQYDNPLLRSQAVMDARQQTSLGLANADGTFKRRMAGLGVELTPEQQASRDRSAGLAAGLSRVNAANMAGRRYDEAEQGLLTGSMPSSGLSQARGLA